MLKILPESAYFLKIKLSLLVGLLVFWCSVSLAQTTISSGNTVNASAIPAGNAITMESNSILNMDVTRTFGSLTVNRTSNGSTSATISGTGTATFSTILVEAGGGQNGSSIVFIISNGATVNCINLSTGTGNRNKSASIQGTLRLSGTGSPISTGWTTFSIGTNSTIEYNGAGQTVFKSATDDYQNLILSGTGVKTLPLNLSIINGDFTLSGSAQTTAVVGLSIGGNITIGSGSTFIAGNFTHTIDGNWTRAGTFTPGTSTVNFTGTSPTSIQSTTFHNLTFSGSGSKTATGNLTITGNLLIDSNFSAGNFTHTISGNWTNSGSFSAGTSTINFISANPSSIQASGSGDFNSISFTGSGTKTINSTIGVSGNISPVSSPVVLSGNNTLTLNTGKTMEITPAGSLTTGSGRLILKPGAFYSNRSTSNPSLEIQQEFVGEKGWRMVGTPINVSYSLFTSGLETQGFTGSTNPTLQPNLLWWDETDKGTTLQGWRQPNNLSTTAPAGRGHYFYLFNAATKPGGGNYTDALPKTISVIGTEVNLASGIFDFGVTFTARDSNLLAQADTLIEVNQANEGFNLIANPTASVIDFHSATGWTKANLDQSIYVWDPDTSSFLTWNGSNGTLGSGRIAPFQAFWVKANAENPILQLTGNGAKSLLSTDFLGRKLEEKSLTISLHVTGEGLEAESFISFDKNGEQGIDPKDAYQLESLAEDWLLLYTYGSLKTQSPLVINNQPELNGEGSVIPLHLAASKGGQAFTGSYLMDWKIPAEWPTDVQVVLMDHIHQKAIDMRKESMHSFTFQGPKIPNSSARKSFDPLQIPKAAVFQSPYEIEEVNARTSISGKPQRPFTIYVGAFPNDRIEYFPDFPKLFAPVPNPFREQTKIRFYLPVAEKAEVSIYDMLGKEVGNFPANDYEAGIQELNWTPNAIHLPDGIYVIRLNTSTGQFTQKLVKN